MFVTPAANDRRPAVRPQPFTLELRPHDAMNKLLTITPRTPKRRRMGEDGTPSSTRTRAAGQGQDSFFHLDFAIIGMGNAHCRAREHTIFGHTTSIGYAPFTAEIKSIPSRSQPMMATRGDTFIYGLGLKLREAYKDVQLKAPVAFRCHPLQKAIIAIAASGDMWSFTVIKKGDSKVKWSKAFMCGDHNHDLALRRLVAAVREIPDNPASFDDRWAERLLSNQARTVYDESDCISTGIPDQLL